MLDLWIGGRPGSIPAILHEKIAAAERRSDGRIRRSAADRENREIATAPRHRQNALEPLRRLERTSCAEAKDRREKIIRTSARASEKSAPNFPPNIGANSTASAAIRPSLSRP